MHHLIQEVRKEIEDFSDKAKQLGGLRASDIEMLYKLTAIGHRLEKMDENYPEEGHSVKRNGKNGMFDLNYELECAEKYLKEYKNSMDKSYLTFAKDKLDHAKNIMEHKPELIAGNSVAKNWYADLKERTDKELNQSKL